VAGLIKAALALHHRVLPPTIKVGAPNPKLGIAASPFYLNAAPRPWIVGGDHPRRAGVSSFGFGGSNFHALLEEEPSAERVVAWDRSVEIIALSAESRAQLRELVGAWRRFADEFPEPRELAYRAKCSRDEFHADASYRLTIVVEHDADIRKLFDNAIRAASDDAVASAPNVFFGAGAPDGKLALLFPGQGSQYVGMARDLACTFPEMSEAVARACAASAASRLNDFVYPASADGAADPRKQQAALTNTAVAQPAIGAISVGMSRILTRFGVQPELVAGHSYGELVALWAAGRINEDEMHRLSAVRGRLMAEGDGDRGAMVAVQAPLAEIERAFEEYKLGVALAHRNSPTQGILSGHRENVAEAVRLCDKRGWRTTPLTVSGAFHTDLMADAGRRFGAELKTTRFAPAAVPVYANCTAQPYPTAAKPSRDLLVRQLVSPVDFVRQIENMYAAGARTFIEAGPKAVLTGLVRSILADRPHAAVALDAAGGTRCGLTDLARVLARLAAGGRPVSLSGWQPDSAAPAPRKMTIPLTGANYRDPAKRRARQDDAAQTPVPTHRIENTNVTNDQTMHTTTPAESRRTPTPDPIAARPAAFPPEVTNAPAQAASANADSVLEVVREGLRAMQALQQQTAAAHTRFLETQEQSQKTFQMVMESQQRLVEATLGLARSSAPAPAPAIATAVQVAAPRPPVIEQAPTHDEHGAAKQVERVLVEVVRETTGYPSEAIGLEMDLEDDLGIDRVGRLHLLARLGEQVDIVHPLNGSQADRLKTLHDIVAYCVSGGMPEELAEQPEPVAVSNEPAPAAAATDHFEATLLDVVADLTGYPVEMLEPDMDLEADLGIDSIKRVEILAEVQTRIPNMAAMNSSYAGSLRTLSDIIDYMKDPGAADSPAGGESPTPVAETQSALTASTVDKLDRRVLRAVPLEPQVDGGRIALAPDREIWIVDDGSELPAALRNKLNSAGYASRVVPADFDGDGDGENVGGLICLVSPGATDNDAWNARSEADLKRAFALAKRTAGALAEAATAGGAVFATVSRMDGAFGLGAGGFDPLQGGLAGLAKTAAHEWPGVMCRAIDVQAHWTDTDAIAGAIVAELAGDGPLEIGLSADSRRGLQAVACDATPGGLDHETGDLVVVTGGARGVTAEAAIALARACRPTLVLLGRSPAPTAEPEWLSGLSDEAEVKRAIMEHLVTGNGKPKPTDIEAAYNKHRANREVAANIERMESAGARVLYHSVDLRDGAAIGALIADLRSEVGPVRALIHGAGVIEDRLIADKTAEQFDHVFDTKIAGLRNLLIAISADELKHLVLFSSVSARFGRKGQVDYAMANEVLNKVGQRYAATHPSCRVRSINWGPWAGGMVTPSLKRDFDRQGINLIALAAGAESMIAEMSQPRSDAVEVVLGASWPEHADAVAMSATFERRLDLSRHGFLNSHKIDDNPVLPIAIMLEWLGHAALHENPGLLLHGFDDFRVLKGVILRDGPCDLHVVASPARMSDGLFHVDLELRSQADGAMRRHAVARAILATTLPQAPKSSCTATNGAPGLDAHQIYSEILFHGSDFHAIKQVHAISRDGASASVRCAPAPSAWMDDPPRSAWLTDPLVVDAALQLGILWCHRNLKSVALPSFGARYRQYRSPLSSDDVAVVLAAKQSTGSRLTADVTLIGDDSRVLAVMEGFEWTVAGSLSGAFGREAVAGAGS
jgi:acyl transferase domain-containing protein/NADP-dependent 3-hydroxy acid dehydrogenase YdfG